MKKIIPGFLFLFCLWSSADCFSQNPWQQKTSLPAMGRHGACSFAIGDRVYFGTGHNNGGNIDVLFNDWWEYDPGTNSWTQKADFGGGLRKWANAFSVGGKGYLGTGEDPSTSENWDMWEYDPVQNNWTQKADYGGAMREGACSFTIGNKGYLGTGSFWADFWAYDPASDTWTQIADFPDLYGRICSASFAIGQKGYAGMGADGLNYIANTDWYEYDPSMNIWTQKASLPGPGRSGPVCFSLGGKGYVGAGTDWPTALNCFSDFYEYNPVNDSWKQIQDFPGMQRRFVVSSSLSTRAYTCTGTNGINLNDLWEFNPSLASGIKETPATISCSIFPNPLRTSSIIEIKDGKNLPCEFVLYDLQGNLVRSTTLVAAKTTLEKNGLSAGIYLYCLRSSGKQAASGKLIVE